MAQDAKNFSLNRAPNPNAQYSVGNFVAFADAAGTSPVDGTGGSPTVTIAQSIVTPLEGTGTLLFTKDAANRQGEGFSSSINLQPSDATKIITCQFDYQITTGTYTGYQAPPLFSDLTCWVYDVTNSIMYQATPYQVDGSVSTTNQYTMSYQWQVPVGCLVARPIWFLGNTSASAFTARFNNISFGRLPKNQGSIQTPEIAYTPTLTGYGTATNVSFFYRRDGDNCVVSGSFTAGTVSGTASVSVPSGLSIDASKVSISNTTAAAGMDVGVWASNGGANQAGPMVTATGTSSTVVYSGAQWAGASMLVPASGQASNSSVISIYFTVPITGWSVNGTLGQDSDTRVLAAKYLGGGTYTIGGAATGAMQFDTRMFDLSNSATYGQGVTFTYFAPVSGIYQFNLGYITKTTSWTSSLNFNLIGNVGASSPSGTQFAAQSFDANVSRRAFANGSVMMQLISGDPVNFSISTAAGTTVAIDSSTAFNFIEIWRMSGPPFVQAPDVPKASYNTTAAQSIANASTAIVNFDTQIYDTFGSVTTGASWKFTASRTGKITVDALITFASGLFTLNNRIQLYLYKNGALYKALNYTTIMATVTDPITVGGSATAQVVAGDYLDVRTSHGEATARPLTATASENYIDVNYTDGF